MQMECAQIAITGGGDASPATVPFPGTYHSMNLSLRLDLFTNIFVGTDPGITINIYQTLNNYTIPGRHSLLLQ